MKNNSGARISWYIRQKEVKHVTVTQNPDCQNAAVNNVSLSQISNS